MSEKLCAKGPHTPAGFPAADSPAVPAATADKGLTAVNDSLTTPPGTDAPAPADDLAWAATPEPAPTP